MGLNLEQKRAIDVHIEAFKAWTKGQNAEDFFVVVASRTNIFRGSLAEKKLPLLTEADFSEVIKALWAMNFWKNKEYKIKQLIQDNGIAKLRDELGHLLYGVGTIDARYDRFRQNVKGFGPAMVTEILITMFPEKYCLWNEKPRNILPFLKMGDLLPGSVFRGQLSGADYAKCIETMALIRGELKQNGVRGAGPEGTPGFWTTDLFMWYLWETKGAEIKVGRETTKVGREFLAGSPPVLELKSHEAVQAMLLELGNLLGYDTYTSDPSKDPGKEFYDEVEDEGQVYVVPRTLGDIATLEEIPWVQHESILESVRRIDVIWFKEEFPEVCFEVEDTTNIKDGLLRQFQICKHAPNAKFFVLAPESRRGKFEKEVTTIPFKQIRNRYQFKPYQELVSFYEEARRYHDEKRKFGLP
jgi:hypothetical protein